MLSWDQKAAYAVRRSKSMRPSFLDTADSSRRIASPASKVPTSDGTRRESPKLNTTVLENARETFPSRSDDRTVTPPEPKLSTVTRSNATRKGGKLTKQKSGVNSVFHFPSSDSASSFVDFKFELPRFMEDAITRMRLGIEDPRERQWFEERLTRPPAVRARSKRSSARSIGRYMPSR